MHTAQVVRGRDGILEIEPLVCGRAHLVSVACGDSSTIHMKSIDCVDIRPCAVIPTGVELSRSRIARRDQDYRQAWEERKRRNTSGQDVAMRRRRRSRRSRPRKVG